MSMNPSRGGKLEGMSSAMNQPSSPDATAAGQFLLGGETAVNRVGYGAMRLSGPNIMGPARDHDEAVAVLRRAVELGVNHIDTSDYYGPFTVNELIREALHPYPADLVLVTKVGARRTPDGGWPAALSAAELTQAVHDNLDHLGVDRMDVVNLRMADEDGGLFVDGSLAEPFEVLAGLRDQGLIHHLGVSNVGPAQLAEAQSIAPVVCVQNMYNISARGDDALIDACAEQGIAFTPFFPVGGFSPLQNRRLDDLAAERGVTSMQLAIGWLLARSPAILAIPGTSSVSHLEENVAAAEISLTAEDLAELDALADKAEG
jgi:aryl-alcohol dehydrogenase-like predicted oxidoreductase